MKTLYEKHIQDYLLEWHNTEGNVCLKWGKM